MDALVHFRTSRSASQSVYGMVPYMQKEYFREDEGHFGNPATPQDGEAPPTRSKMALRAPQKCPPRVRKGATSSERPQWEDPLRD